ncbi:MAG: 3-dehydroquinate synthase [Candidatus Eremiobacteraeota bacterium]|nr:3-dehydroquinate synthase [Candidatus Eremiobacteraeota bacterium]
MPEPSRNDDLGYPIVIGYDLRGEVAGFVRRNAAPMVILCDGNRNVRAIAESFADSLGRPQVLPFPLGESRKRLRTVERVLDAMLRCGVERSSLVVGVGGGVACDLFGFACAIYMRGIRYAHVATSLLAMVDAAIGGKTGVDLNGGKNLAGSFHDPAGVFCELTALRTLPRRALREGLAEIVKAAIIEGGDFFDMLEELAAHPTPQWPWASLIEAAVKVKTMTVADDRVEAGTREVLNLGHTFAHAIERGSGFQVAHGEAVAVGLRAAGLLALRTGRFSEAEHFRVITLLTLLGLPLQTTVKPGDIVSAMHADKKKRRGRLRFVLPRAIGDVESGVECDRRSVLTVATHLGRPPEKPHARR